MKQMLESAWNKVELSQEQKEETKVKMYSILQGEPVKIKNSPHKGKRIGFSSLAMASLFVLMVNISPPFALACSRIPFLDKLAQAVNFSYSLSRALEEEFVQVVGQSQTQDGITLTVEHLIVDQKELNIFFTIEGENGIGYRVDTEMTDLDGVKPDNLISWGSDTGHGIEKPTDLRQISFGFRDTIPSPVAVTLKVEEVNIHDFTSEQVHPEEPEGDWRFDVEHEYIPPDYLTEMTFVLEFDSYFTEQVRIYEVNQTFELNGQSITIEHLEVYPTQMQMTVVESEENKKELSFLTFDLYNQNEDKLEGIRSGLTVSSSLENPEKSIYYLESDFFDHSESLKLVITEAEWLDQSREPVKFDLKNGIAEWMFPETTFSCEMTEQGYVLNFDEELITYETEDGGIGHVLGGLGWSSTYYNQQGDAFYASSLMSYIHTMEDNNIEVSRHSIPLHGYFEDFVWLMPTFDEITEEKFEVLLY